MKLKSILLLLMLTIAAYANPYILVHDDLIDQRAQDKIMQIGSEAKAKMNVNIYVHILENNGIDPELPRDQRIAMMKQKNKQITKDLPKPYVALVLALDQKYANILMSDNMNDKLDKDDILDSYVIPLLASKDKNSLFAKTSAACLNGYAQIADSLANTAGIKLESSIGSEGKTASTIWRVFMYTLVLAGILLYAIIVLRERKFKKIGNKMSQDRDTSKDKYIYIKFAIIFFFTLGMIVWTIMETAKAGVGLDDDNAFLSTYHDVDADFNKMAVENNKFNNLYNIKFDINEQSVYGLEVADIYLSQRVIKEREEKKDMLKVGKNTITIQVQDKQGNAIDSKNIQMMVTKSTTHEYDVKLDFQNETKKEFDVATVGYWNLTGVVEVNGQKGYFYIKTNATSK